MEGYNLLTVDQIFSAVVFDSNNVFAYLQLIMGNVFAEFFLGFLSTHLKTLGFRDAHMGYWFALGIALYVPACVGLPIIFKSTPPKV